MCVYIHITRSETTELKGCKYFKIFHFVLQNTFQEGQSNLYLY